MLLAAGHREYGSVAALATEAHQASRRKLGIAEPLLIAWVEVEHHRTPRCACLLRARFLRLVAIRFTWATDQPGPDAHPHADTCALCVELARRVAGGARRGVDIELTMPSSDCPAIAEPSDT